METKLLNPLNHSVSDTDTPFLKLDAVESKKIYEIYEKDKTLKQFLCCINGNRVILDLKDSKIQSDHRDTNGLNNQRNNLRPCTNLQNQRNKTCKINGTSKYKGVYWNKKSKKWDTRISVDKKRICGKSFKDEIEAAKAYDEMAKLYFGEFAYLNFKD